MVARPGITRFFSAPYANAFAPLFNNIFKHLNMDILIFTTSVEKPEQVTEVRPLLTAVPAISGWNFDLEDCDKILRIEAHDISPRYIESLLQTAGFECHELEY
jgi:hypothetical protein